MRLQHGLLAFAILAGGAAALPAQARMRPAPSGRATSEVTLAYPRDSVPAGAAATARIRIDYGQPHLRGRALNTDSLVPYDKPWRTGANNATTFTTDVDLVLGGQPVAKGTYTIWTIPSRGTWRLMLQKSPDTPSMQAAMTYDAANDAARVELRKTTLQSPVESLTMWLIPSTAPGAARGELRIAWGTTQLSTDWSVR